METAKTNFINKAKAKWENEFPGIQIDWEQIYTHYCRSTTSTKLRNFQYKCLAKIVATNDYLYKCNIVNTNLSHDNHDMSFHNTFHIFDMYTCVITPVAIFIGWSHHPHYMCVSCANVTSNVQSGNVPNDVPMVRKRVDVLTLTS